MHSDLVWHRDNVESYLGCKKYQCIQQTAFAHALHCCCISQDVKGRASSRHRKGWLAQQLIPPVAFEPVINHHIIISRSADNQRQCICHCCLRCGLKLRDSRRFSTGPSSGCCLLHATTITAARSYSV